MKTLLIFLLFCGVCWAGENQIDGMKFTYNDKYSLKDYTKRNLMDAKDLEGITIYASCFSHETPDSKVFPDNVKKLTLVNCNLDNVYIKTGWVVIGGSQRRYKVQIDKEDWIIDEDNKPIEPINKETAIQNGKNIDPTKIKAVISE